MTPAQYAQIDAALEQAGVIRTTEWVGGEARATWAGIQVNLISNTWTSKQYPFCTVCAKDIPGEPVIASWDAENNKGWYIYWHGVW